IFPGGDFTPEVTKVVLELIEAYPGAKVVNGALSLNVPLGALTPEQASVLAAASGAGVLSYKHASYQLVDDDNAAEPVVLEAGVYVFTGVAFPLPLEPQILGELEHAFVTAEVVGEEVLAKAGILEAIGAPVGPA
ncbi:hypothetical protein, partial [Oceanithermus sp.]|uniref:hypothetical protein n=1 Tax=Oceanithermus sp. TaxID=2268145 RepID=UPI0025799437